MTGKTELVARALVFSGMSWFLKRLDSRPGVLCLAYHRIGDGCNSVFDRDVWSATPEQFDGQIRLLKQHFNVISCDELPQAFKRGTGRYALITFDDGYRDNYLQAAPILKSNGVSGTFFISTGFLDHPHVSWWDEIAWMVHSAPRAMVPQGRWVKSPVALDPPSRPSAIAALLSIYKSLPGPVTGDFLDYLGDVTGSGRCTSMDMSDTWMTWDMVRQLRRDGMCIGGHTVNHPILARLPLAQQRCEIAECRQRIEAELGEPMRAMSYPRGKRDSFNQETRLCLREEGVELAFSYYGGFAGFEEWDPYDIPRAAVDMTLSRPRYRAIVAMPQVFS